MSEVGIGIVGAGIMGRVHADALGAHPHARVRAVASRSRASADKLAGEYGATTYDDWRALVEDQAIDIVTVATPDHLHAPVVEAAAVVGKHALIEKPFTTDTMAADRALAAVRSAGVHAMTLFNHRWVPAYAQAHERITAGEVGTPSLGYARKNDRIFVPTEMIPWAAETTCAWFLSSHDIDLVTWMFGDEIVSVYASAVSGRLSSLGIDTPDAIQAQCRFREGGVATFESCWTYPDSFPTMVDSFVEVVGSSGVIHLDRKCEQLEIATDQAYEFPRNLLVRNVHGVPAGATRDAIHHFVDCVREDREPLITLESSRDVTAVLAAIHRSVRSGQPEVPGE